MKKITIEYDVAADLLSKLTPYRNRQNCIRFVIGKKAYEDGLASQVSIVNNGQMAQIGFTTTLPDEPVNNEMLPYMAFNLKADDFCSYLSAYLGYKTDITLKYNDVQVKMIVGEQGEQAKTALHTIPDESCEPLLMQDHALALAKIQVQSADFQTMFRKGSFLSDTEVDTVRKTTDRVVLKIAADRCYTYSSDGHSIAKAWCNATVSFEDAQRALYHLRLKGAALDPEQRFKMATEMEAFKNDASGMIKYAQQSHGYVPDEDISISLPGTSVATLSKIITGAEELFIIITPDNIHIKADNILATFALAGEVSSVYQNTVDPWEHTAWTAKVVTDKESFVRALGILKLAGEDKVPFHIAVDDKGIITTKTENELHTSVLAREGKTDAIDSYYSVNKIMEVLSKLSNGNLILRFMTDKRSLPLSISNGNLEETDIDSYAYILPVNMPKK